MGRRYPAVMDLIDRIDRLVAPEAVWQAFVRFSGSYGLCRGGLADLPRPDESLRETIVYDNWPDDWRLRYLAGDYVRRDPAVLHMAKTVDPFTWSEALALGEYSRNDRKIVHEASEFNMAEGFVVPLLSVWSGPAVVTMAGEHLSLSRGDRADVHLAAIYCHARIRALSGDKRRDLKLPPLSRCERECLRWAAAGKSDWEIGEILSISERRVNMHLARVKAKYGVTTRVQAIVFALRTGAIKL